MLKLRALLFAVFVTVSLDSSGRELLAGLERISFSSFRPDGWDIWLLEPNKPPQRLTDHPALDYDPAWSPDGRYIVFTSERLGEPDLFVIDTLKRGPERPLVIGEGMKDQAAFSPDGRTLVFVSTRDGKADLYSVAFDPSRAKDVGKARRLTDGIGANLRPTYSPDGRRILFTSTRDAIDRGDKQFPFAIQTSGNLFSIETKSGEVTRLTAISTDGTVLRQLLNLDAESLATDHRGIMGMVWSPDGQDLAFAVKRFRNSSAKGEIWRVRRDGSDATAITGPDVEAAGMPDFGAHGSKLVFAAKVGAVTNIMMMGVDGTHIHNLTDSTARENFPTLSPAGDMIAYASDREGLLDTSTGERRMALYVAKLTAEGSLRDSRRITDPSTQSGHPRFSPDGQWLVYTTGVGGVNDEQPLLWRAVLGASVETSKSDSKVTSPNVTGGSSPMAALAGVGSYGTVFHTKIARAARAIS